MMERGFHSAWTELLTKMGDRIGDDSRESAWWRCVAELLWSDVAPDAELVRTLKLGPLATAAECARTSTAAMLEALRDVSRGPQKASVLIRLAQWWVSEFGDNDAPDWRAGLDDYRQSLRAIRGIGPETADRLLLFAAGLSVFPVDRAVLRIAVRHGWLDWPADDETAQSTFQSVSHGDIIAMQHASRRLKSIGSEFCGRTPNCEACPLARWLGETGPLHIDQC